MVLCVNERDIKEIKKNYQTIVVHWWETLYREDIGKMNVIKQML